MSAKNYLETVANPVVNVKPDAELWLRLNTVLLDAPNAGVALTTIIGGMSNLIVSWDLAPDLHHARAMLAAMILSPDDMPEAGSLLPLLDAEIERLRR